MGIAKTKPASGPLIAMSNRLLRSATPGPWMMTAPIVPNGEMGNGMKKGNVAGTL
jgi:hypothetical protein